jgi:uncharacterized protein YyaL (SSP411 family)
MAVLARARRTLFEARGWRPRPHLDDKVITAWNGLMIAAFARAARVLVGSPRREEWRTAAIDAAQFVRAHLWQPAARRLLRRYRDGEAAIDAFCEDYAYLAWGALELFQATGDVEWLAWARDLTEAQTARFFDPRDGGWFSTTGEDASVLLRVKEDYDGAEPAAASIAVRNLITMGHLLAEPALVEQAGRTLERYGPEIARAVRVMPMMVANVALWHGGGTQIVIVGDPASPARAALESVVARQHLPWAVVVPVDPGIDTRALDAVLPWLAAMRARGDVPVAYVCHDFACQQPVTDPEALGAQLDAIQRGKRVIS